MSTKTRSSAAERPREEEIGDVWFETRWGMTMFVLAACLAGTGLLFYLATYMAWF